jgi:hypothetical protein
MVAAWIEAKGGTPPPERERPQIRCKQVSDELLAKMILHSSFLNVFLSLSLPFHLVDTHR